jgi:hypothetical protein
MEAELSTVFLGIISSAATAWITYFFTRRSDESRLETEKRLEQKYKYFFPFKNECIEFKHRVKHIARDLNAFRGESSAEKKINQAKMKAHFKEGSNLEIDKEKPDWFFVDFYSRPKDGSAAIPGGYFFTSTLYMHCLLFRQITILQTEHPFMSVELNKFSPPKRAGEDTGDADFFNYCKKVGSQKSVGIGYRNKLIEIQEKGAIQSINTLIEAIRLSTVFSGGLPYNMHNSFGTYVMKGNGIISYEEFCSELANKGTRTKFLPLIRFWQKLGSDNEEGQLNAINSLCALYTALELIEYCDLR